MLHVGGQSQFLNDFSYARVRVAKKRQLVAAFRKHIEQLVRSVDSAPTIRAGETLVGIFKYCVGLAVVHPRGYYVQYQFLPELVFARVADAFSGAAGHAFEDLDKARLKLRVRSLDSVAGENRAVKMSDGWMRVDERSDRVERYPAVLFVWESHSPMMYVE